MTVIAPESIGLMLVLGQIVGQCIKASRKLPTANSLHDISLQFHPSYHCRQLAHVHKGSNGLRNPNTRRANKF